jgi:hypothetical protein
MHKVSLRKFGVIVKVGKVKCLCDFNAALPKKKAVIFDLPTLFLLLRTMIPKAPQR